jgi:TonB family protein
MKNIFVLVLVSILTGLSLNLFAQTKNIPPSEKELPFDKAPGVIKQAPVVYPPSMLDGGWEAIVYIKAFITTEGAVGETKIEKVEVKANKIVINEKEGDTSDLAKQTDGKAFEESALASVNQWKFTPAQMQGKPVAVWITIPFRFKLSEDKNSANKEGGDAEMEKATELIKTHIENILQGTDKDKTKSFINKNALLVYNNETVNLQKAINGEYKKIHLEEGKESQRVNINIKFSEGASSAVVVWRSLPSKGKSERTHSIVLSKASDKGWKITHWHVSF